MNKVSSKPDSWQNEIATGRPSVFNLGDWQLMQNNPFSPLELYHLKTDPQERTNLAATNKKMFNELATTLRSHTQRGGTPPWHKPPKGYFP